jgi:hypothetical protein
MNYPQHVIPERILKIHLKKGATVNSQCTNAKTESSRMNWATGCETKECTIISPRMKKKNQYIQTEPYFYQVISQTSENRRNTHFLKSTHFQIISTTSNSSQNENKHSISDAEIALA